jgi:hypothetical protein
VACSEICGVFGYCEQLALTIAVEAVTTQTSRCMPCIVEKATQPHDKARQWMFSREESRFHFRRVVATLMRLITGLKRSGRAKRKLKNVPQFVASSRDSPAVRDSNFFELKLVAFSLNFFFAYTLRYACLLLFYCRARILSTQYKGLSDKEMKKWQKKAEQDKIRYQEEMKHYVPIEEPGGRRKKAKKDPSAPKRNMSAYFLYSVHIRPSIKADNPESSFGDIARLISSKFKELPDKERKIWDAKAEADKIRYQQEMAVFRGE